MKIWTCNALGSSVAVRCDDEVLARGLEPLLHGYGPVTGKVGLTFAFERAANLHALVVDGKVHYQSDDRQALLDCFELTLYQALVAAAADHLVLHAAMLSRDGHGLVLMGASGSGKSTLTRALLTAGWAYHSEEIVALRSATAVLALRRPLHLATVAEREELPASYQVVATAHQPPRWLGLAPAAPPAARGVAAIVLLRHDPAQPSLLSRLSAAAALEAMWSCRLNTGLPRAQIASAVVSAIPCYALRTADRASALALLGSLIETTRA